MTTPSISENDPTAQAILITQRAIEIHEEGTGWKPALKVLRREYSSVPSLLVYSAWDKARKPEGTASPSPGDGAGKVNGAVGNRPSGTLARSGAPVQKRTAGLQGRSTTVQNGPPASTFSKYDADEGLLGLSLLSHELGRRWRYRNLGDMGTWRPERGSIPRPPHDDPEALREWARLGGQGEYLLHPDAVHVFLQGYGLNPDRVITDLRDKGITRCDSGHNTKLVRVGPGKANRMIVLPDRWVRRRSSSKLGSAVAKKIARRGSAGI